MTQVFPLQSGWKFRRLDAASTADAKWMPVDLPHSPFVADLDGQDHWFGECEYELLLEVPTGGPVGRWTLYVGAAMHTARVFVDGVECGSHLGGYLPFEIDLTHRIGGGAPHTLTLRLDNRNNSDVPPGKPAEDLDFCWYGGLYREVELRCYPPLHITDPVGADAVASGGVFVRTMAASEDAALVSVRTQVRNSGEAEVDFDCLVTLKHVDFAVASQQRSKLTLAPGASMTIETELRVARPALWQLDAPALHHAIVSLRGSDGVVHDVRQVRFGIRRIAFSRSGGFQLNGRRLRLRGTNRHQDYPFAGYALPAAAQRRDARRIKEAGFDYVRLSHYPQSPDFLDACDEYGLVVMNCIPGWQFLGGDLFRDACERNVRELIRRDRNHPCVVLWELSLNETEMDAPFMARLHQAGHDEYPGDQMFTCGWQDCYDVYTHSRQHGQIHLWRNGDKALVVAEYGDWEFYASNHGFDQKTGAGVFALWSNSRQRRQQGERALRQQVENHLLALSDTLSSPAVFDGQWSMFDYPRGYAPERAACGVMDFFRLPKFSYHFYRSQRDPQDCGDGWSGGPSVFIASHWTPTSSLRVLVFSNCEEVELRLNGRTLGRSAPCRTGLTQFLPHPPFVFELAEFIPGSLEAVGYIGTRPVMKHAVGTPGPAAHLSLEIETMNVHAEADQPDLLFAHARVLDSRGQLCIADHSLIAFSVEGTAGLLGDALVSAEAGIASTVIRIPAHGLHFRLLATRVTAGASLEAEAVWTKNQGQQSGQSLPVVELSSSLPVTN